MPCQWATSSAGRAPRSQRGGRGFESHVVHHFFQVFLSLVLPSPLRNAAVSAQSPRCARSQRSRTASVYQIVWIPTACRRRSRVTRGKRRWRAVAAMMRSGMSGTMSRGMCGSASATPPSTGAINSPESASVRAARSRSRAPSGSLRLSTRYTVSTREIADTRTARASRTAFSIVVRATVDNYVEYSKYQRTV